MRKQSADAGARVRFALSPKPGRLGFVAGPFNVFTRCFVMEGQLGLHARPAALFAQTAQRYDAGILIGKKGGPSVSGKSILELLGLEIQCGNEIVVTVEGSDAAEAISAIERLFINAFGERPLNSVPGTSPLNPAPKRHGRMACMYA